ncbi:hypothetical protein CON48_22665 [Bacillus thuringiensis]|uniref:Uncharacterized protein n=1 Tax=Bacillus thuringiensis TaxID=1428 RepID=A0ABD6SPJ0_BACTU|nr:MULTISPECIES: hypothetical protein [Bacillus]AJQ61864.1 hypothetical protein SD98_27425 [Bacillus thuringiensis serovar morrisoni]AMR87566.1 hypothetical protein A3L20_27235 [Bacillus thuringiensis]MBG9640652.1 hypothetical protein [Bacillus thuringiensis]MBG9676320.1 hypothetical protein [Bacillus thuringiensis]MBJ8087429.1 hypothetical protein [Bacillus cereus]
MNNRLSAIELLSIGYNKGLTDEEKITAVQQLEARKKQQAEEAALSFGNPFLNMRQAYGDSTSRREERQQQDLLEAKMKRLAELELKQAAAQEEYERKQQQEAKLERLSHLEQAEKAGLI